MRSQLENGVGSIQDIHLLVFSIMGIRMGVDMEQIYEMKDPGQVADGGFEIAYFHEMVPFYRETVSYKSPKILLFRNQEGRAGVIIDQPEDILPLSLDSIRPLPPLLETGCVSHVVWGAALQGEEIILLVDFLKLK